MHVRHPANPIIDLDTFSRPGPFSFRGRPMQGIPYGMGIPRPTQTLTLADYLK